MALIDPQLTASQVLRVFHRDEIALFLGAAFTTVGLVIAAFLIIRRRFEALLFWLALFAILYGNRLWMQSELLGMLVPTSEFFTRLKVTIDFVVAIPAFLFFQATGFLGKPGKLITYISCGILFCLLAATVVGAQIGTLENIASVVVICGTVALAVQSLRHPVRTKDFVIVRNGLLIFVAFVLWNNIEGIWKYTLGHRSEPYGFAVFLGCLGYVAARRTVERDQQFSALQKELEVARRIQLSILPNTFPASEYFQVAARYVPMTAVAGDFYDFLVAQGEKAGLLIADVSGHGVPAALIASMVKLAAISQREHSAHPAKLLAGMNSTLFGNTQSQFVTAAYVHLDAQNGSIHYAAAGHLPMLLLREGEVFSIEENGMVLALFSTAHYTVKTQPLKSGDRFVLYTDGIVEAEDAREEQFGHDRLCELLRQSIHHSPDETADLILDRVRQWSVSQDDDRTILVCDYQANHQV
jgi:sigma-B regulation protein RsbU (phosphoserine phosphatase)